MYETLVISDSDAWKVKKQAKIHQVNENKDKTSLINIVSHKIKFKAKDTKRDQDRPILMLKNIAHNENIIVTNIFSPNYRASFIEQEV